MLLGAQHAQLEYCVCMFAMTLTHGDVVFIRILNYVDMGQRKIEYSIDLTGLPLSKKRKTK